MSEPRSPNYLLLDAAWSFGVAAGLLLFGIGPWVLIVVALAIRLGTWFTLGFVALAAIPFALRGRKRRPEGDEAPPPSRLRLALNAIPWVYAVVLLTVHSAYVWAASCFAAPILGNFVVRVIATWDLARMDRGG